MPDKFAVIKKFFEEDLAFDRYLGLLVEEVREGYARCRIPYKPELLGDPFRPALHGGVTSALVDASTGLAAISTLPLGSLASTVDLRVDYLRPGAPQDLFAEAQVLRSGSQIAVIEVLIYQETDCERIETARGRAVYSLKRLKPGPPSITDGV